MVCSPSASASKFVELFVGSKVQVVERLSLSPLRVAHVVLLPSGSLGHAGC
jgi:hypothetical protein